MRTLVLAASGRRILYTFLMTVAGIVVGAIVGLITISEKIPVVLSTVGLYLALLLSLGGAVLVVGLASVEDLRELIRRRRLLEAVSSNVVFKRYQCVCTIDETGDAELEYTIEIELDPVSPARELRMPIWLDIPSESAAGRGVTVRSLTVEGRESTRQGQSLYEPLEVRHPVGSGRWVEFGVLRIPLIYGMTRQVAQARLDLARAFPGAASRDGDAWTLEVGHLIEFAEVTIRPRSRQGRTITIPPPIEEAVRCGTAISAGGIDYDETRLRSLEYRETGEDGTTVLAWSGDRPKLGYLYQFRFRVLAVEAGSEHPAKHRRRFLTRNVTT
jgi:hypothetical protein